MKHKQQRKLSIIFSFVVFFIMVLSMVLVFPLVFFIMRHEYFTTLDPVLPLLTLCFISVVIGTSFSAIVGKRILRPIVKLNEATKEVAKGNFNIALEENNRAAEIHEMTRSFNIMVKELAGIETFRNDFVSNVSHEFKTPISAIEGYATLLQDETISTAERDEYIRNILANTRRLSNLSGNILKISRLENQEIVVKKSHFDLDEQIRQVLLTFEQEWTHKNLELDLELEDVRFYSSEDLLAQVWSNLIDNAIKFSHQNGTLKITLQKQEHAVTVTIEDNGIGMSEMVRKHIFEKFYQGDKSHYSEGNGLGLTLVKRIVDLCGGTITVDSEEGKGTVFTVSFMQ